MESSNEERYAISLAHWMDQMGRPGHAGVALLDMSGSICYLNAGWKRLIGVRSTEGLRLGSDYVLVFQAMLGHENTYYHALAAAVQAVLHGERTAAEVIYPHECGGQWQWFQVTVSAINFHTTRYVLVYQELDTASMRVADYDQERNTIAPGQPVMSLQMNEVGKSW